MEDKAKKTKIIAIVICCLAFVCLVTVIFQFVKLGNLQAKENELNAKSEALNEVIAEYNKEKNYYADREKYLDEYAHEVLNMAKDGEIWYTYR